MSCITGVGRFTFVVINLIFVICALGLIAFGIILLQGYTTVFKDHIDSTVDDIQRDVKNTFGQDLQKDLDVLYKIYSNVGVGMTIFGIILLILSAMALFGSCCKWRSLLFIYAFAVIVLIATQIVIICLVIFEKDTVLNAIKSPLKDTIKDYEGSNGTNEESWAWNFIMRKYECCGIDDYTDFKKYSSKWWGLTDHLTPYMCCINFPRDSTEGDNCAGASNTAAVSTIAGKNYYDKGCLEGVWDTLVTDRKGFIIIAIFVLFICQFLVVVFACILYWDKGDDDDDNGKKKGKRNKIHPNNYYRKRRQPNQTRSIVAPQVDDW